MNHALRPHQWVLMGVLDDRAGDNHAVSALHGSEVGAFGLEAQTRGQRIIDIPPVRWQACDTFVRVG